MIFIYFFAKQHKYNLFFYIVYDKICTLDLLLLPKGHGRKLNDEIFSSHLCVPGVVWTLMQGCLL